MRDAFDPEVQVALEAIDAALAGEPVDPELAEVAELSLLLHDERALPDDAFLASLDARAARRFAPAPAPRPRRRAARGWWLSGGVALAGAAAIAVAVVVGVHPGGGSSGASRSSKSLSLDGASAGAAGAVATSSGSSTVSETSPAPAAARGRDVAQTAQLVLRARAGRIDGVAQQVLDVVGAERGYVGASHVTALAGGAGVADFTLRVPSGRLRATLTRLSSLGDARVTSRSDASADVTGDVNATAARLAVDRALRRSLLRALAAADTTAEIDRAQAALARNQSAIVAAADSLARLHGRVTDSTVTVTVSAPPAPGRHGRRRVHRSTLGLALHDAGRVLLVAAAVVIVGLAVLVPLSILVAIGAWAWALTLRRRRESALGP